MDAKTKPTAALSNGVLHQLIDGHWVEGQGPRRVVRDKFSLQPFAELSQADEAQVQQAVALGHAAFRAGAPSAHERGLILDRAAALVEARSAEFVRTMQQEAGFTQSLSLIHI